MITAVGIITAPRPDSLNYISNSLDSYFREWDIQPLVFAEPGMHGFKHQSRCKIFPGTTRLGIVRNWIRAAKDLLTGCPDSDWLMICEDDIEWCVGSARLVRAFILDQEYPENLGFVSAYTCVENAMRDFRSGEWHYPYFTGGHTHHWCGACALIFPREPLTKLVFEWEDEFLENCKLMAHDEPVHLDCGIAVTLASHHYDLRCHSPSLVDHKGEISTNEGNNVPDKQTVGARTPAL